MDFPGLHNTFHIEYYSIGDGMKFSFEDYILLVGVLALITLLYWKGWEEVVSMFLTFLVSTSIFYYIATKIRKRLSYGD
ncbi:NADH-quinone oxidoreductase subunit H [bacterium]|nr:NADH-quinone oxidoreductase subunit H [bacterium]